MGGGWNAVDWKTFWVTDVQADYVHMTLKKNFKRSSLEVDLKLII